MTEVLRVLLTSKLTDPDPVVRAHAAARLAAPEPAPEPAPDPAPPPLRSLADSVRLMQAAARCPYRSTSRACGCFACALAPGSRRTAQDCWSCVETYGVG